MVSGLASAGAVASLVPDLLLLDASLRKRVGDAAGSVDVFAGAVVEVLDRSTGVGGR